MARIADQVLKYWWRVGLKGDPGEDCEKARWYLSQLSATGDASGRRDVKSLSVAAGTGHEPRG